MSKSAFRSLTLWSAMLAAAIEVAEKQGAIPGGTAATLAQLVSLGGVVYGRWRASAPLSLSAP